MESEQSPKLRNKGYFRVDNRFVGYATEDFSEYEQLKARHPNEPILFTDRSQTPKLNAVEGTSAFHEVAGVTKYAAGDDTLGWKVTTAQMPCTCLACRGQSSHQCPFVHIRKPGTATIKKPTEQTAEQKASRAASRAANQAVEKGLEAQVQTILGQGLPVTCLTLRDKLGTLKLKKTGNELDLMKRLIKL